MLLTKVSGEQKRALRNWLAKPRDLRRVDDGTDPDNQVWEVESQSHPGTYHRVRYNASIEGVQTHCRCEAARHRRVCQHQMAVLYALGMVTADDARPDPLPYTLADLFAREDA